MTDVVLHLDAQSLCHTACVHRSASRLVSRQWRVVALTHVPALRLLGADAKLAGFSDAEWRELYTRRTRLRALGHVHLGYWDKGQLHTALPPSLQSPAADVLGMSEYCFTFEIWEAGKLESQSADDFMKRAIGGLGATPKLVWSASAVFDTLDKIAPISALCQEPQGTTQCQRIVTR